MPFTNKPFGTEDKIKMFERMGATAAVIALIIIMLIESGYVGEYKNLADMGLPEQQHRNSGLADAPADRERELTVQKHPVVRKIPSVITAGKRQLAVH